MNLVSGARARIAAVPVLAVFIAVFAWGIGPLLFLAPTISINSILFYRVLFWPPLLYLIARRGGRKINKKLFRSVWLPGVLFGVSTIFGFTAIIETSVANATIIGNISTAMVLFAAPRFLNEKISRWQVLLAFTSFAGVVAIVVGAGNTGGSSLFGDFLALINALTWTFYFISSKRRRVDGVDTWQFLYGVSVIQVLVVVPYSLITSDDILQITLRDLGFLIVMTLFFWHDRSQFHALGTKICRRVSFVVDSFTRASYLIDRCMVGLQPKYFSDSSHWRCCGSCVACWGCAVVKRSKDKPRSVEYR